LVEAGINEQSMEGIDCMGKKFWYIVFYTTQQRTEATGKEIKLHNITFVLKSLDPPRPRRPTYIWVKVFGYPLDTDSQILEHTLSLYGKLVSITDDIDGRINIKTGVKHAQFESLTDNIPSFIYAGKFRVRTVYRDQPRTCRNCMQTGHEAKDCTAGTVCKQCGKPGHKKGECPDKRCFHCKGKGHEQKDCVKYVEDYPALYAKDTTKTADNTDKTTKQTAEKSTDNTNKKTTEDEIPRSTHENTTEDEIPRSNDGQVTEKDDNATPFQPPSDRDWGSSDWDPETKAPDEVMDQENNTTAQSDNPETNTADPQHMDTQTKPTRDSDSDSNHEDEPPPKTLKTTPPPVKEGTEQHPVPPRTNNKEPPKAKNTRNRKVPVVVSSAHNRNPFISPNPPSK
jgi:hypothetical protein